VTAGVFGKFKNTIVSTASPKAIYPKAPIVINTAPINSIPLSTTFANLAGSSIDSAIGNIKLD
jgi:hypothetical protein